MTRLSSRRVLRRWSAVAAIGALAGSGCALGGESVEVTEPIPSIFPDEVPDEPTSASGEPATPDPDRGPDITDAAYVAERLAPLPDDGRARAVVTESGVSAAVTATDGENWTILTPCGARVEVSSATVLTGAHVVIDAGHGGVDSGVVGPEGLRESDLNLEVASQVVELLESHGVVAVLSRTGDYSMTVSSRAALASALEAHAMVSIHHDEDADGPASHPGTEAWYQVDSEESRRLAGLVHEELRAALGAFDIDWVANPDGGVAHRLNQRGTDYHDVLRESAATPAVLVQAAFLSNPAEEAFLRTSEGRAAEAAAIARAVVRFLVTDSQGSGFVDPVDRVVHAPVNGQAPTCVDPRLDATSSGG